MAPKLTLDIDPFEEYEFIGISCHLKDYRLVHFLNQGLRSQFSKTEDFFYSDKAGSDPTAFSVYFYEFNEMKIRVYLLSNRNPEGILISEQKRMDYLLIFHGAIDDDFTRTTIKKIKEIPNIQIVFQIDPNQVKMINKILNDFELHLLETEIKNNPQKKYKPKPRTTL